MFRRARNMRAPHPSVYVAPHPERHGLPNDSTQPALHRTQQKRKGGLTTEDASQVQSKPRACSALPYNSTESFRKYSVLLRGCCRPASFDSQQTTDQHAKTQERGASAHIYISLNTLWLAALTRRKEWRRGWRALAGRSSTAAAAEAMAAARSTRGSRVAWPTRG